MVEEDIKHLERKQRRGNKNIWRTIKQIGEKEVVIRPADKGGGW